MAGEGEGEDHTGLPLREALEAFSDPERWAAYRRLPSGGGLLVVHSPYVDGPDAEIANAAARQQHAARREKQAAWRRLVEAFVARLRAGELVASGVVVPLRVDNPRVAIPAGRWRVLQPDFRRSAAKGGGLEVIDILVRHTVAAPETTSAREHGAAAGPGAVAPRPGPGRGGRA